ncbi:hypothetical protein F4678DRAFT_274934 [Xylaria arbuscula]|nr:hypothetical protein F4678DRAFT_274934 [Xylaria arbuscula]
MPGDTMPILQLPAEIIRHVLTNVEGKQDLKAFCEVSKAAYEHAAPVLYQSVPLTQHECSLNVPNSSLTTHLNQPERPCVLDCVKELCLTSGFQKNISRFRCYPHFDSVDEDRESGPDTIRFIQSLKEGQLRKFSWHLGICIPYGILSRAGCLSLSQKNIKSISLITSGRSCCNDEGCPVYLKDFEALESLSWVGIRGPDEFATLRDSLALFSEQLVELHLDGLLCEPVGDGQPLMNTLVDALPEQQLVCLKRLSLGALRLRPLKRLIQSLNMLHLQSLRLRSCPDWSPLLLTLYKYDQGVALKSFELQFSEDLFDSNSEPRILRFLKSLPV